MQSFILPAPNPPFDTLLYTVLGLGLCKPHFSACSLKGDQLSQSVHDCPHLNTETPSIWATRTVSYSSWLAVRFCTYVTLESRDKGLPSSYFACCSCHCCPSWWQVPPHGSISWFQLQSHSDATAVGSMPPLRLMENFLGEVLLEMDFNWDFNRMKQQNEQRHFKQREWLLLRHDEAERTACSRNSSALSEQRLWAQEEQEDQLLMGLLLGCSAVLTKYHSLDG